MKIILISFGIIFLIYSIVSQIILLKLLGKIPSNLFFAYEALLVVAFVFGIILVLVGRKRTD